MNIKFDKKRMFIIGAVAIGSSFIHRLMSSDWSFYYYFGIVLLTLAAIIED